VLSGKTFLGEVTLELRLLEQKEFEQEKQKDAHLGGVYLSLFFFTGSITSFVVKMIAKFISKEI
jgi:hypothetical protein